VSAMETREAGCGPVRENLWRYIDRELSAGDLAAVSAHLKTCPDCSRLYESGARDAKLCRMAFVDSPFGERFVERFRHRYEGLPAPVLEAGDDRFSLPGSLRSLLPADSLTRRRFFGRVALAAALVMIAACVIYGLRPEPALGKLVANGPVDLSRGAGGISRPDGRVLAGDKYVLAPEASLTITLADSTSLVIDGPAGFRIDEGLSAPGRFEALLEEGVLQATVRKRRPGEDLIIRTPDALAHVVGTRFTLDVSGTGTIIKVQSGEVIFWDSKGEGYLKVNGAQAGALARKGAGRPEPLPPPLVPQAVEKAPSAVAGEAPRSPSEAEARPGEAGREPPPPPRPSTKVRDPAGLDQPVGGE
jgi:hypothetical protein